MRYAPGDQYNVSFGTHDATTGSSADADSTPTGTLRRNGSNSGESVTIANNATGDYTASGTIPAGWSIGDDVELVIEATVGGVTAKLVIGLGQLDVAVNTVLHEGGGNLGSAWTATITVEDEDSNAIEGAHVRLSLNGISVVRDTDANGEVEFSVDNGTYDVAITRTGFAFDPTTLTVDGANVSTTYTMSETVVSPPADPSQTTGFLTSYDGQGNKQPNASFTFWLVSKDEDGQSFTRLPFTAESNSEALLEVTLVRGATYLGRRESTGTEVKFIAQDEETFALPTLLAGEPRL